MPPTMIGKITRSALVLGFATALAEAQTPTALRSLSPVSRTSSTEEISDRGIVAGNNPWLLSASMSLKPIAGDGRISDDWLFSSAKIVYELPLESRALGKARIPLLANLAEIAAKVGDGSKKDSIDAAIQSLVSSEAGLNVGIFPYWVVRNETDFRTTLFTFSAAKVNSYLTDSANKTRTTLLAGRFGGGIEFAIGKIGDGANPLTLSFAGVYSKFSGETYKKIFSESRSSLSSVEFTAILPLKKDFGVLFEGIGVEKKKPSFRLAMLFTAGKGDDKKSEASPSTGRADDCAVMCTFTFKTTASDLPADFKLSFGPASSVSPAADCGVLKPDAPCTIPIRKNDEFHVTAPEGFVLSVDDTPCSNGRCAWPVVTKPITVVVSRKSKS